MPPTNGNPLRVLQLEAIDFKRLRALTVTPGAKCVVVIKGPNEAGKTSAIDAMAAALAGKRASPELPIRTGADSSTVRVTLGDDQPRYTVTRNYKGDKSTLAVKAITPDGDAKLSGAQGFLDGLLADISFNPLAFARAAAEDQVRMLFAAIGAADKYADAQARRRLIYEDRTTTNRTIEALAAKLKANPDPAPGQTLAEVPDQDFAARLAQAQAHNQHRAALALAVYSRDERIAALKDQIQVLNGQITALLLEKSQAEQALERLPAEVDTAQITAAIARNRQANDAARRQTEARKTADELARHEAAAAAKTTAMQAIDGELRKVLEGSQLGQTVPGLTVTAAGEVLHNGVPFSQASGMRRLEISCLVGMASNPKLRVMTIDEGDRLDPQAMAALEQIATEQNFQVWMTAVYAGHADEHTHVCELADGAAVPAEAEEASNPAAAPVPFDPATL